MPNVHDDSRFIIDRLCKHCGAKMMRAARHCPSCHLAVDGSGRKMPQSAGFAPILVGTVAALGLIVVVTVGFLASGTAPRQTVRAAQKPIALTALERERERADADVLCWLKFLQDTGGLIPNAVHGASFVGGSDAYRAIVHAWTDDNVIDVEMDCDVENGLITSLHLYHWYPVDEPDAPRRGTPKFPGR